MNEELNTNNINQEETEKSVKLLKVYSLRLVSLLDLKPHDIVFSTDYKKLVELHNNAHLDESYKLSDYPNFNFQYEKGTPLQWYLEPIKEFTEQGLAGIYENWVSEENLKEMKSKSYFIE